MSPTESSEPSKAKFPEHQHEGKVYWIVPMIRFCDGCAGSGDERTAFIDGLCVSFETCSDRQILIAPDQLDKYRAAQVAHILEGKTK